MTHFNQDRIWSVQPTQINSCWKPYSLEFGLLAWSCRVTISGSIRAFLSFNWRYACSLTTCLKLLSVQILFFQLRNLVLFLHFTLILSSRHASDFCLLSLFPFVCQLIWSLHWLFHRMVLRNSQASHCMLLSFLQESNRGGACGVKSIS